MAPGADPDWIDDDADADGSVTGEAISLDVHPTGFVLRAAGALLDAAVAIVGYIVLVIVAGIVTVSLGTEDAVIGAIAIALFVVCFVGVPMTIETLTRGRSLGKLAIGGRIVRRDGGAIGLRHAAIRALVGVFEFYTPPFFGGTAALVGLLTPRTQRLGDLLAGTYCRYERVSGAVLPLFSLPPALVDWGRVADVARMPTALARRVSQFLAQAPQYEPERRARLAAELATEAAEFVAPLPDVAPELFLAGVAVLRRDRESERLRRERAGLDRLQPALRGIPHGFPDRDGSV